VEQNSSSKTYNRTKIEDYSTDCFVSTAELLRPRKKAKIEDLSTVTLAYISNKRPEKLGEDQRMRVLFDSGCGSTLINKKFVRHWKKKRHKTTKWATKAGSFRTRMKCEIEFSLPAFHENRVVSCNAYVDESPHDSCNYDIIIGRDLMHSLGINLLFDTAEISWDNATIPMKNPEHLCENWIDELEQEVLFAHDPATTDAERIQALSPTMQNLILCLIHRRRGLKRR